MPQRLDNVCHNFDGMFKQRLLSHFSIAVAPFCSAQQLNGLRLVSQILAHRFCNSSFRPCVNLRLYFDILLIAISYWFLTYLFIALYRVACFSINTKANILRINLHYTHAVTGNDKYIYKPSENY